MRPPLGYWIAVIHAIGLVGFWFQLCAFGDDLNRSPVDIVLSPDQSWITTANQTSNSVSLMRTSDGEILDELVIGDRPAAIALHPHGNQVLVTSSYSGILHWIEVAEERLKTRAEIWLGYQPHGVAVSPDGQTVYVALTDADQIAVIDLPSRRVVNRIDVGRWPRYLALSQDGSRMAVGTSGDRGVSIVDTREQKLLHIDRFVGLNIGHMQLSHDGAHVYFPRMVYRRNPINERNIRLGWVMASRLGRIPLDDSPHREAISLDPPGRAVADPHGLALTSDEQHVVISASGTQELLVLRIPELPFQDRGSTDHIDEQLLEDESRFYRIELGGRPMGLRIASDNRTVYVANYLDNSVQVVDLVTRTILKRFHLGGEASPSLVRKGEAIFYDARRSLDQWYSCHSCHYDGGTNAVTMDTVNDGSQFTFKTVLPLYQIDRTGPWTWHGWQEDLNEAMRHSLKTTMLGPPASEADTEALIAFLRSMDAPPNSNQSIGGPLSESAHRGQQIFMGTKGGCSNCHSGPHFSDGKIHDLALGASGDAYDGYNTPSLKGVFRKVLYLHDGRIASLIDLLTGPHAPENVEGERLTEQELTDLVAFLRTL